MKYDDNRLKRITRFLWKYFWCIHRHDMHICFPRDKKHWHCRKCHQCMEGLDILLGKTKFKWL